MCDEDTPDHIFIDVDSERFVDLLRDPWASEPWIAPFQFNNGPRPAGFQEFGDRG